MRWSAACVGATLAGAGRRRAADGRRRAVPAVRAAVAADRAGCLAIAADGRRAAISFAGPRRAGRIRLFRRLQLVSSAHLQHWPRQQQRPEDGRHHLAAAARRRTRFAETLPGWVSRRQLCRGRRRHAAWRLADRADHGSAHRQPHPRRRLLRRIALARRRVHLASYFGIPISTTQTITASIVGVGIVNRLSSVRWGVAGVILWSWLLTLPAAGLLGALAWYLGRGLF